MESKVQTSRARPAFPAAVLVLLLIAAAPPLCPAARAQTKKPITKDGLVKAVKINGLSTSELVEQIVQRGVSFKMTSQVEAELRASGARPEIIEAARSNYRPGPVLAAPGGRRSPVGRPPISGGPDYDDLTDQATSAISARDEARATQLLQQAITLRPAQPRAYQLLGFTDLYLRGDLSAAERNMRAAVERGGSAAFRVFHDHAGGSFNNTCEGSLFITRSNVTFRADNGVDTFETLDSNIKEIKTNRFVGANPLGGLMRGVGNLGAFHIKVKRVGDEKNYNFAPLTKKKKESELIIGLVRAYGGIK